VRRKTETEARITLRRLAQTLGKEALSAWREPYDHQPVEDDDPVASAHG